MARQFDRQKLRDQSGFTLIEMLVVVIILGILAMIIVPQITVSTEDARLSTMQTNLNSVRGAIEAYYAHHGSYPATVSETDGTSTIADADACKAAFMAQLGKFTDLKGAAVDVKDDDHPYGPYLKFGLPANPYVEDATETVNVLCDKDQKDISTSRASNGTAGWQYWAPLGLFFANDSDAHAKM